MKTLTDTVDKILWQPDVAGQPVPVRLILGAARLSYAVGRELFSGQLTLRAMSLVYTTLLSTVPLLAFSFSLIKVFGVHNTLKPRLYGLLEPLGPKGAEITDWVIRTVDSLQGGVLGAVSLAFFIYTAIEMVQKVEESFNYVWLVTRPRSLARRVSEYVSVLLIGPVVIAAALGLIATISNDAIVQEVLAIEPFGTTIVLAGKLLPWVLLVAVFTLLYKLLPNSSVRLRAALTGGAIAAAMWTGIGAVFATVLSLSAARNAIYGTFAVAISALIWLYLSWLILLVGAQIAFYVQHPVFLRLGRQRPRLSNELRERMALNIMYLVGVAFRDGSGSCTIEAIARDTNIPGRTLGPIVADLEAAGLIGANEGETLLPGRDLSRITLAEILAAVRSGGDTGSLATPAWSPPVNAVAERLNAAVRDVTANTTLSALLDQPGTGAGL
jgi:membrane protein